MTIRPDQILTLTDRLSPVLARLTVEQAEALLALNADTLLARLVGTSQEPVRLEPPVTSGSTDIVVLTLGNRTYELVPFLEAGETSVSGDEMVRRAERLNANLGEADGRFILAHQADIPDKLREKIAMVFTAWRDPGSPRYVVYSNWVDRKWVQVWYGLDYLWDDSARLVRRRK